MIRLPLLAFILFPLTSLSSPKHLPFFQKGSVRRVSALNYPGLFADGVSSFEKRQELCCTCAFCATSSTSWNFSDTVRSSFGGSCIEQRPHLVQYNIDLLPMTLKQEAVEQVRLPRVQRPQAQCSTGSSNLWMTMEEDMNNGKLAMTAVT